MTVGLLCNPAQCKIPAVLYATQMAQDCCWYWLQQPSIITTMGALFITYYKRLLNSVLEDLQFLTRM